MHTYNGTNLLTVTDGSKDYYVGIFLIDVDFGNGTGELMYARTELSGTSGRFSDLRGSFNLNTETGNFSGDEFGLENKSNEKCTRKKRNESGYLWITPR